MEFDIHYSWMETEGRVGTVWTVGTVGTVGAVGTVWGRCGATVRPWFDRGP